MTWQGRAFDAVRFFKVTAMERHGVATLAGPFFTGRSFFYWSVWLPRNSTLFVLAVPLDAMSPLNSQCKDAVTWIVYIKCAVLLRLFILFLVNHFCTSFCVVFGP